MILDAPKTVARRVDRRIVLERLAHLTEALEGGLAGLARRPTPKAVHEARIMVRRLQAALRHLKHQLPSKERKACIVALSAITRECNAVRDADVRSRLVRHWLTCAGLKDHEQARVLKESVERSRAEARRNLRERIHEPKWDKRSWKLRQHEIALVRSDGEDFPVTLVGDARERYRKSLRDLPDTIGKGRPLHRFRLRIKDARYFLEDFGPLLAAPREGDLARLRGLQKTLGELHDEWQLRQWLRGQYKCYLVTGELLARLKAHEHHLLKRIRRLRDLSRAARAEVALK
jgi:CHAD domain-containing protein